MQSSNVERVWKKTDSFLTVSETPGQGATPEQFSMLMTRYERAAELSVDKEVLEVACGSGIGLGLLARRARRVVAGDYDQAHVQAARSHYRDRIHLLQLDAHHLPFKDNSFDVVMLMEALYYLADSARFVAEAGRILRPGGILYINSANREWALFNPSPFSQRYCSAGELQSLMSGAGFATCMYAGFPDVRRGLKSQILSGVRRAAVRLGLIPRTMSGKEKLKRLLYGKLTPLPAELEPNMGEVQALVPILPGQVVTDYKVLYALGTLKK